MCLAIPVKIVEIDKKNKTASGEIGGVRRELQTGFLDNLKVGDYVLLHAGFAIQKINKKEAKETLSLFKEIDEIHR